MRPMRLQRNAPRELAEPAVQAAGRAREPAGMPGSAARERARVRLVGVVLAIYLLAIFEGSIRKYVVPQFGQVVFFIRDPLLIYAFVLATRFGLWPRYSVFYRFSLFMAGFGVLLLGLQIIVGGFSETRLLLGVYGWRAYFLYVPLACLVGAQFRAADIARFARVTLLLAVPIAVLVAFQFSSPMDSVINVGIAAEKELQFQGLGLNADRIRATGTFTSSAGQQQFVVTACVFALAFLLLPTGPGRPRGWTLALASAAILTCVALGGSRGTTLQCALSGLYALSIGFIGRGAALKAKAIALPSMLGLTALVLYPIVFPAGFDAFVERWNSAAAVETAFEGGVFGRALYGLVEFVRLIEQVPALGYGLGYGGNASITLRATIDGVMPGLLAENDYARHMVDIGPAFGIAYIVFRVVLVCWLLRQVVAITRRVADPLPMMLFGYASYVLLLGQLTGQGSINVYGWLFTGLCLAAVREAQPLVASGVVPARAARTLRRLTRAPGLSTLSRPARIP